MFHVKPLNKFLPNLGPAPIAKSHSNLVLPFLWPVGLGKQVATNLPDVLESL